MFNIRIEFIARIIDIPMFNVKYREMHIVQMHAGAILTGLCACMENNPLAKARGLSSRTDTETIQ